METWSQLEENLIKYRDITGLIRLQLLAYMTEINKLIYEISCKEYENTLIEFDRLFFIQNKIATALYKYGFDLPEVLDDFVRNFDRDDDYSRKHWYVRFKDGFRLNG